MKPLAPLVPAGPEETWSQLAAVVVSNVLMCAHCHDMPASCIGVYEDPSGPELLACDRCCAHGCDPTLDALRDCIRDTLDGAEVKDPAIVTAILVADIVDNFDIKLKETE